MANWYIGQVSANTSRVKKDSWMANYRDEAINDLDKVIELNPNLLAPYFYKAKYIYDFGYQADGIESAAKIYFNKKPLDLSLEESATLVGMLKNSSLYNPRRRPKLTTDRRNVVFNQMYIQLTLLIISRQCCSNIVRLTTG